MEDIDKAFSKLLCMFVYEYSLASEYERTPINYYFSISSRRMSSSFSFHKNDDFSSLMILGCIMRRLSIFGEIRSNSLIIS